jgi:hypothetical protein
MVFLQQKMKKKKSLDFAAKQSNQEQLRSIMGRKRRKLNSPQRGTKQRERLSQNRTLTMESPDEGDEAIKRGAGARGRVAEQVATASLRWRLRYCNGNGRCVRNVNTMEKDDPSSESERDTGHWEEARKVEALVLRLRDTELQLTLSSPPPLCDHFFHPPSFLPSSAAASPGRWRE